MSHLCDSTVASLTAWRENALASKCEYPPFGYPAFEPARQYDYFNSVQTRCIVKANRQKNPLFWRFSGVFDFLRIACSLGIPQENL